MKRGNQICESTRDLCIYSWSWGVQFKMNKNLLYKYLNHECISESEPKPLCSLTVSKQWIYCILAVTYIITAKQFWSNHADTNLPKFTVSHYLHI